MFKMFKIIKKSEYEKLKLDLELKNKEISNLIQEKEIIFKEGELCYKIDFSIFGNSKIHLYKQIGNKLEYIREIDYTKENLDMIKSKIKSYEELEIDYLLSL